jgi:glycosyltransferase involved in cell wall biosynthesis
LWILVRNPVAFIVGNWRFLTIARRFRPTRIHTFNAFFVWSFLPAILMLRTPLIYRCGDAPVRHRWVWRAMWRVVVWRTRRFVAISHFIAGKLEAAGVPPDRIEVMYGIPPARMVAAAPAGAPMAAAGPQDIVFVGQIIPDKGPDLLIEAFRSVAERQPASRLLIAGRISDWRGDDWAKDLRDRVARDPVLGARVVFTGFVEDVPALLRGRMVLVAPTVIEEALGLVVMEAKAAGVPAIVFPTGGLPEMIELGVDGFVCREASAEALAEKLVLYLDDPALAARHGRAACASLQRFDVDRFSARCLAAYTAG